MPSGSVCTRSSSVYSYLQIKTMHEEAIYLGFVSTLLDLQMCTLFNRAYLNLARCMQKPQNYSVTSDNNASSQTNACCVPIYFISKFLRQKPKPFSLKKASNCPSTNVISCLLSLSYRHTKCCRLSNSSCQKKITSMAAI